MSGTARRRAVRLDQSYGAQYENCPLRLGPGCVGKCHSCTPTKHFPMNSTFLLCMLQQRTRQSHCFYHATCDLNASASICCSDTNSGFLRQQSNYRIDRITLGFAPNPDGDKEITQQDKVRMPPMQKETDKSEYLYYHVLSCFRVKKPIYSVHARSCTCVYANMHNATCSGRSYTHSHSSTGAYRQVFAKRRILVTIRESRKQARW